MLPGPAVAWIPVSGGSVPAGTPPVLPHRADPDADPAGGRVAPGAVPAAFGAGRRIGEAPRVVPLVKRGRGTGADAEHAPGAEVFREQRIGWQVRGGEDRAEPDPGAVLRREERVVHAEGPEPREERGVTVREE